MCLLNSLVWFDFLVPVLGGQGVALQNPVRVALNAVASGRLLEAVFPPGGVEEALFDADEVAAEFLSGDQTRSGTGEGVQDQVAGVGAGQE